VVSISEAGIPAIWRGDGGNPNHPRCARLGTKDNAR
jgi:hypothetical protein